MAAPARLLPVRATIPAPIQCPVRVSRQVPYVPGKRAGHEGGEGQREGADAGADGGKAAYFAAEPESMLKGLSRRSENQLPLPPRFVLTHI
jgi:hypothetical protein